MSDKSLIEIWKIFKCSTQILSIANYDQNSRKMKIQFWYRQFLLLNLVFCFVNSVVSVQKFINVDFNRGILLIVEGSAQGLFIIFRQCIGINEKNEFEKVLKWIECWFMENQETDEKVKEIFETFCVKTTKLFKGSVVYLHMNFIVSLIFQSVLLSIINSKPVGLLPNEVFWSTQDEETFTEGLINSMSQFLTCLHLNLLALFFFGFNFLIIEWFLAILKVLENKLENLQNDLNFQKSLSEIINLHVNLSNQQKKFVEITSIPIFFYESFSSFSLLISGTILLFDKSQILVAFITGAVTVPFGLLAYWNEKLASGYEDLSRTIYDLNWYAWTPNQRKILLPVILAVNRPVLLRAGPFHRILFEQLKVIGNRVYSFLLVINKLLRK